MPKRWEMAEKTMASAWNPETARTSGLISAQQKRWASALVRLSEAAYHGLVDRQTLDSLGEAAYRTKTLEALLPFARHYSDPLIATHMARALFFQGALAEAEGWLKLADPSLLHSALADLLRCRGSMNQVLAVMCRDHATIQARMDLDFPAYWQALAAISACGPDRKLLALSEERTKAFDFANPVVHFNQSLRFLLQGEWRAGWKLYDWRLHPDSGSRLRTDLMPCPMWQGEKMAGKRILVVVEYGLGDQIFALRFLHPLCATGASVEVAVRGEIYELVRHSFSHLKVHLIDSIERPLDAKKLGTFDYWTYALSVPSRIDLTAPVGRQGYLKAAPNLVEEVKERIHRANPGRLPTRGLVWHGDVRTPAMRTRAFSVENFFSAAKLEAFPAVWVILQKDVTADERAWLSRRARDCGSIVIDAGPSLVDFHWTAAWITGIDELISCDTSVAHAGGALGHPTRVLIKNRSIWQWRTEGEDKSAWYDSARVEFFDSSGPSHMFDLPTEDGPSLAELVVPQTRAEIREWAIEAFRHRRWPAALMWWTRSARLGARDPETLWALAECAYRAGAPEILASFQNEFKHPELAAQMARAFMMMGDVPSTEEFLGYAAESGLKHALHALLQMERNPDPLASELPDVARNWPDLDYPEFWRALAAVADAAKDIQLCLLAETKSQASAYADPNIHFNQALRLLGKKELLAGWRQYEFRLIPGVNNPPRPQLHRVPLWEGEDLTGRTLLIYLEQGLGDEIFALRFVRRLLNLGCHIQVSAHRAVVPLVRSSFPDLITFEHDELVSSRDFEFRQGKPDLWTYSLSVPARAGFFEAMAEPGYLKIGEKKRTTPRERLAELNPLRLPVYVVNWHGRIDTDSDRSRAYTAVEFVEHAGILKDPCCIVSVQKDADSKDISYLHERVARAQCVFFDASDLLHDLEDTGAWILESKRLFTCDTSVAHLGGALGHPTTVLVRNKAIWQWAPKDEVGENLHTSLWYDSVNIRYALAPDVSWMFSPLRGEREMINERKSKHVEVRPENTSTHNLRRGRRLHRLPGHVLGAHKS